MSVWAVLLAVYCVIHTTAMILAWRGAAARSVMIVEGVAVLCGVTSILIAGGLL